jgi:aminoglycoside phosphotransferase (APT) family kinase protein
VARYDHQVENGEVDVRLVRCLLAEQFPEFADLPVRSVELDGWDNTTFRVGDHLSARLPSHERYVAQIDKEHRWLPVLGPLLPLPIPSPVATGRPGCGFPRPWSLYGWLDGEPAATAAVSDELRLAGDLARFLAALHALDAHAGPPAGEHSHGRGGPVSVWEAQVRSTLDLLADVVDVAGVRSAWARAVAADPAPDSVWVHGDVTGSNLLVRDGELCAVIDFGCSAVGDPACDLTPAWTMFDGDARAHFLGTLQADQALIDRARGWALWKALISIPGVAPEDPARSGTRFGWRWSADEILRQTVLDAQSQR